MKSRYFWPWTYDGMIGLQLAIEHFFFLLASNTSSPFPWLERERSGGYGFLPRASQCGV
jgi:hypothetical protein